MCVLVNGICEEPLTQIFSLRLGQAGELGRIPLSSTVSPIEFFQWNSGRLPVCTEFPSPINERKVLLDA